MFREIEDGHLQRSDGLDSARVCKAFVRSWSVYEVARLAFFKRRPTTIMLRGAPALPESQRVY